MLDIALTKSVHVWGFSGHVGVVKMEYGCLITELYVFISMFYSALSFYTSRSTDMRMAEAMYEMRHRPSTVHPYSTTATHNYYNPLPCRPSRLQRLFHSSVAGVSWDCTRHILRLCRGTRLGSKVIFDGVEDRLGHIADERLRL